MRVEGYNASTPLSQGRARIKAYTLGFRVGEEGLTDTCQALISSMLPTVRHSFELGVLGGMRLRSIRERR